jgi:hypothetical protein
MEAMLREVRKFVLWWDRQEKHPGGRPSKNLSQIGDRFFVAGKSGIPVNRTIHRWRSRTKDDWIGSGISGNAGASGLAQRQRADHDEAEHRARGDADHHCRHQNIPAQRIAAAKRNSLAVMGFAVKGARILSARETRVGVRNIMSRLRPHCVPRSKMARPPISAR